MAVKHNLVADGDPLVGASDWNANHDVDNGSFVAAKLSATATDVVFGRSSSGAGNGEEITVTAAARSVLDDTTTGNMLSTLGAAAASHTHSAGDVPDLDSLTAPSADVSLNSHKITNLTDPSSNQDAATKKYVDDEIAGVSAGSSILAVRTYTVTPGAVYTTTSSTLADVDASNLYVTFTAPASGNVLVRMSCWIDGSASTLRGYLGLRESTTDIGIPVFVARDAEGGYCATVEFYITGISAGSHTYKLSYARATTGNFRVLVYNGTVDSTVGARFFASVTACP